MWTLLLSRQADPPGTFIDRRQIDSGEIRIGRDAVKCDWVLADTSGHISRAHCTVSVLGLDLFVTDTSTNGVSLNRPGQRIAPQMPVAVRVNDRLLIGDYAIEVTTEAAGLAANLQQQMAAAAPPPPPAFTQPDSWFDAGSDPWATGGPSAEVHEFLGNAMHDFLAPPRSAAMASPAADPWGGPLSDAFSRPILSSALVAEPSDFAIPEDWAAPPPPRAAPPAADPFAGMERFAAPVDPFAGPDPFAAPPPPAAPDPFAASRAPVVDPFAAPLSPPTPPDPFVASPAPAVDPFAGFDAKADPFAGFGKQDDDPFAMPAPPSAPPVPADDPFASTPAIADPFALTPPAVPAPPPAPAPPSARPADPGPNAAGWAAFCEGAGIDPADLRTTPDAMHRLGVLYKQVVLGLTDLIQDRAAFKNEFRVERTQLGLGRNNPLKHLPALDSAKLLLGDPLPGFMGAEESVRSAFEDVKKHQLAMLAGVQHALRAVFERLSPDEIQRVMEKAAGEKKGLRIGRGVNPWTVYQAVFDALRKDATSNVNSIMSVAFREGYEAFLGGAK